ncbi:MAG: MFS transporter [Ruminococcaceae bacterium]|nr:MFS transporter [Oscillospiraceae bacterium]
MTGFIPYILGALLISAVGGFTTVLGPAFVKDLQLPYNNTTWTALAMATSTATLAPVLGKVLDVIGRRKTLLFGIAVFALGNGLTAMADSLWFMMLARFTVGVGTAAVAPVVLSYIVTSFPQEKVAKGFSFYMLISSAAVIFGPTAGGFMVKAYGWRIMMWLCTAASVLVFIICAFRKDREIFSKKSLLGFDGAGAFWVFVFFGLILCIPSFWQNFGITSPWFIVAAVLLIPAFLALYFTEKKANNPILQWSFMNRKPFILSVLALFLTQGLMQANMTNIIVFVNYTQPHNTVISGYAISIMYVGMSLGSVILGPLADRREPKWVLVFSLLLTGIGCGIMLLFTEVTSVLLLGASLGILGLGLGGNATVFMKVVLSGVPVETAGTGTGTYGLFRDLAAPFGVAVLVPLFTNGVANNIAMGKSVTKAALYSVRTLAIVEIIGVLLGIIIVLLLPTIYKNKGERL